MGEHQRSPKASASTYEPRMVSMEDVTERPIEWLWEGRFALGRLSVLAGNPGTGKSYLTCDMAARVSTGSAWPDGSPCDRGSVLLLNAEDDAADTIKPRLRLHGAAMERVHVLSGVYDSSRDDEQTDLMVSLSDVPMIEAALKRIPDCRLIVIDPVGSYIGRGDTNKDNEIRAVLAPIAKLSESYGVAVLLVMHRRKGSQGRADDTVLGSRGFTGIARSVWHLGADVADAERRLLLSGKSNLAKQSTGLAFSIVDDAIVWEPDPVQMTADDAMSNERDREHDDGAMSATSEARDWLRHWLSDGPKESKETKAAAKQDGIAERTLQRAAQKIGIDPKPGGYGKRWVWALPE